MEKIMNYVVSMNELYNVCEDTDMLWCYQYFSVIKNLPGSLPGNLLGKLPGNFLEILLKTKNK